MSRILPAVLIYGPATSSAALSPARRRRRALAEAPRGMMAVSSEGATTLLVAWCVDPVSSSVIFSSAFLVPPSYHLLVPSSPCHVLERRPLRFQNKVPLRSRSGTRNSPTFHVPCDLGPAILNHNLEVFSLLLQKCKFYFINPEYSDLQLR